MDQAESKALGGILIAHNLQEGKHEYKVENVVKYEKMSGERTFARKGDTLLRINDIDLENLTPEEVAYILAEDSPKLTVHKSSTKKEPEEQAAYEGGDIFFPVSKTNALLIFNMKMCQEDGWVEDGGESHGGSSGEASESEEKFCSAQTEENGVAGELFIVSMEKTTISVLKARGGDDGCGCSGCLEGNCIVNDVIVVAESSRVTLVPRGSESFRMEKLSEKAIQTVSSKYYLHGLCSQIQSPIYASPNPEKMTIYYYKSKDDGPFRGMPVVLNFTGSNCFLKCCKSEQKVSLQIATCAKERLRNISKRDPSTFSFLFYMKSDRTKHLKFESALYPSWFIQVLTTNLVDVAQLSPEMEERSFLFIIQSV